MGKMKLCKDCKYLVPHPDNAEWLRCTAQLRNSPVNGLPMYDHWRCNPECQREDECITALMNGTCGRGGTFWRPR